MVKGSGGGEYYYAGGKKVELTPADDLLAIDKQALAGAGLPEAIDAAVQKAMRSLSGGVGLVDRTELEGDCAEVVRALQAAKATYPVFRSHGAVIVALPEVRVEETRGPKRKRLADWLASHSHEAVVESQRADQVVLKPASGKGGDALTLANRLTEQVGPEMAQVRFLRVTSRPSTVR